MRHRIVERLTVRGRDILENENNWRGHPKEQVAALRDIIEDVGIARTVVAYYSERNGGKLTLIDGHARVREYPDTEWQVDVLDVTDDEADKLLLAMDAIGDAARVKLDVLKRMRRQVSPSEALSVLINKMTADTGRIDYTRALGKDGSTTPDGTPVTTGHTVDVSPSLAPSTGAFYLITGNKPHLLYCGDWLDIIEHVIDKVDFLLTDPPYGIGYESSKTDGLATIYPSQQIAGDDDFFDPTHLLNLHANIEFLWGANHYANMLPISRGWVVWDKVVDGQPNSYADVELAWSNQDIPVRKVAWKWRGMMRKGGDKRYHPTQKPEGVIDWIINTWWRMTKIGKSRAPANIFDPYAGSGTIMMVADDNNIPSISCEIAEEFAATIIARADEREMSAKQVAFEDVDFGMFGFVDFGARA